MGNLLPNEPELRRIGRTFRRSDSARNILMKMLLNVWKTNNKNEGSNLMTGWISDRWVDDIINTHIRDNILIIISIKIEFSVRQIAAHLYNWCATLFRLCPFHLARNQTWRWRGKVKNKLPRIHRVDCSWMNEFIHSQQRSRTIWICIIIKCHSVENWNKLI